MGRSSGTGNSIRADETGEAEIILSLIKEQDSKSHIVAYFKSPQSNHKIEDSAIPSEFIKQVENNMEEIERLGSVGLETCHLGEEIIFLKKGLVNAKAVGAKKITQQPGPGITFSLKLNP